THETRLKLSHETGVEFTGTGSLRPRSGSGAISKLPTSLPPVWAAPAVRWAGNGRFAQIAVIRRRRADRVKTTQGSHSCYALTRPRFSGPRSCLFSMAAHLVQPMCLIAHAIPEGPGHGPSRPGLFRSAFQRFRYASSTRPKKTMSAAVATQDPSSTVATQNPSSRVVQAKVTSGIALARVARWGASEPQNRARWSIASRSPQQRRRANGWTGSSLPPIFLALSGE